MPNNQSNERLDSIQCIDGFSSYHQCLSSCHSRLSSYFRCHSLHGQYLFAHFLLHVMRLLGKDETGQQSRRHRQWQFTLCSVSSFLAEIQGSLCYSRAASLMGAILTTAPIQQRKTLKRQTTPPITNVVTIGLRGSTKLADSHLDDQRS